VKPVALGTRQTFADLVRPWPTTSACRRWPRDVVSARRDGMKELVRQARDAMRHAWAPYSNFHVGAAIEAGRWEGLRRVQRRKRLVRAPICAERMALGAAVVGARGAEAHRRDDRRRPSGGTLWAPAVSCWRSSASIWK